MFSSLKVLFIMDPIQKIHPVKDTTFRLMLEAQNLGYKIYYAELQHLFLKAGRTFCINRTIQVYDRISDYWSFGTLQDLSLTEFDVVLMRKDPPVNMEYIYATHLLEKAELEGTLVVNSPKSLRDANEKLYATWFPQCMPDTIVSANAQQIKHFIIEHQTVVLKPLGGMAGQGIFKCNHTDPNLPVIIETITKDGQEYCMVQQYIPDIIHGDKRIILIDGEPIPFALARIPTKGDFRGNLARGADAKGVALTNHDRWICSQIAPTLRNHGLLLVGIDVIGDYLTEINLTSPTCVRELEKDL